MAWSSAWEACPTLHAYGHAPGTDIPSPKSPFWIPKGFPWANSVRKRLENALRHSGEFWGVPILWIRIFWETLQVVASGSGSSSGVLSLFPPLQRTFPLEFYPIPREQGWMSIPNSQP